MYLFGLKKVGRPLAAVRFGGMRFLRVGRSDTKSGSSDMKYLRHASAMSAAIAKNMSSLMSQSSEIVHGVTKSDASSFLDTHNHYSFIAVIALMSLFLVVTISATGLLIAFCRKKNTVFTAPPKSDVDSQFELDDIESSDTEMYRGDKGEYYIHLSNDYDEDNSGESNSDYDDRESNGVQHSRESDCEYTKRSKSFPQFRDVLKRCRASKKSTTDSSTKKSKKPQTLTALIPSVKTLEMSSPCCGGSVSQDNTSRAEFPSQQEKCQPQIKHQRELAEFGKIMCHNPKHKLHYYHTNFHYHCQHQSRRCGTGRTQFVHPSRNRLSPFASCRLQRSQTIHDIPLTERRSSPRLVLHNDICDVKILVEDVDKLHLSSQDEVIRDSLLLQQDTYDTAESDIFNDEDDQPRCQIQSPFDNLKLRLEDLDNIEHDNGMVEKELVGVSPRSSYNTACDETCRESTSVWVVSRGEGYTALENGSSIISVSRTSKTHLQADPMTDVLPSKTCTQPALPLTQIDACQKSLNVLSPVVITSSNVPLTNSTSSQNKLLQSEASSPDSRSTVMDLTNELDSSHEPEQSSPEHQVQPECTANPENYVQNDSNHCQRHIEPPPNFGNHLAQHNRLPHLNVKYGDNEKAQTKQEQSTLFNQDDFPDSVSTNEIYKSTAGTDNNNGKQERFYIQSESGDPKLKDKAPNYNSLENPDNDRLLNTDLSAYNDVTEYGVQGMSHDHECYYDDDDQTIALLK